MSKKDSETESDYTSEWTQCTHYTTTGKYYRCKRQAQPSFKLCAFHRKQTSRYNGPGKRKFRQRWREEGKCTTCGTAPATRGVSYCEPCYQNHLRMLKQSSYLEYARLVYQRRQRGEHTAERYL